MLHDSRDRGSGGDAQSLGFLIGAVRATLDGQLRRHREKDCIHSTVMHNGVMDSRIRVSLSLPRSEGMDINKDLIAASSTPLVLSILAEGDSYGYAILKRVSELSGGRMEWTDGMLYPVLHRLERLGHVEARWEAAETGRRRKYYRITAGGRAQLADERRQWQAVDATLHGIWGSLSLSVPASAALLPERA